MIFVAVLVLMIFCLLIAMSQQIDAGDNLTIFYTWLAWLGLVIVLPI
jgi:hypothetical protein